MDKDDFLMELANGGRAEVGRVAFADQSLPQKIFTAIWELESEVSDGGFDQYLRCCDSDVIAYTPAALRAIGASRCAATVENAILVIQPLPPTQEERFERLDDLGEEEELRLSELDEEFDACPDNLTDLLHAYVVKHPEAFGPVTA
jgi:Domain of unknown function (DUF4375)